MNIVVKDALLPAAEEDEMRGRGGCSKLKDELMAMG
jgi:hypothetical protein